MPLYLKENIAPETFLAVWEITESLEELLKLRNLTKEEQFELDSFSNLSRKKQWLSSRILISELCGKDHIVEHNKHGVPRIKSSSLKISISHTSQFVAVMISAKLELGVDIEAINERALKVKNKFLSEKELNFILNTENPLENVCLAWSAKEALFKVFARPNIDFRESLFLEPYDYPSSKEIKARVCKDDICKEYLLKYYKIKDHILVYVSSKD